MALLNPPDILPEAMRYLVTRPAGAPGARNPTEMN